MIKKKLQITNDKELKRFYNHLFFYRSLLNHFTKFELAKDNYNLDQYITALNYKGKRRVSYVYNETLKQIDDFYHNQNICGFICGKCIVQREKNISKVNGCCHHCLYQTDHGCPSANISCKLFNCSAVRNKYKVLTFNDLKLLKCLSFNQQVIIKHDYFTLKEDAIKDLNYNLLIFVMIRMIYRFITNHFKLKRKKIMK